MEQNTYADRKSRAAFQEADGKVTGWMSFGQGMVFGPGMREPYRIGPGHLFTFSEKNDDLRQAIIVLRDTFGWWAARLWWFILTFVLGAGLGRLYERLF